MIARNTTCLIALMGIGVTLTPALALEGFRFMAQHQLDDVARPSAMVLTRADGSQCAVFDGATRELVFTALPPNGTAQRIALDELLAAKVRGTVHLDYDATHDELLLFSDSLKTLYVLTREGKLLRTVSLATSGPDPLDDPVSFAVDPGGLYYIGDPDDRDIKSFTRGGTYLSSLHFPLDTRGRRPVFHPYALAVLGDGTVAAADTANERLVTFAREGRYLLEQPLEEMRGRRLGRLIALTGGGLLGYDDQQRIYRWDLRGRLVGVLGSKGVGRGQFSRLVDLQCDSSGRVLALDGADRDIQVFTFDSPCIPVSETHGTSGYAVQTLATETLRRRPVSLWQGGRIDFDPTTRGAFLVEGATERPLKNALIKDPSTACVTDEHVYVFDRGSRDVIVYDRATGLVSRRFGGSRAARLDDVRRILPGPGNTLLLADHGTTAVRVFTEDGIFSSSFGTRGRDLPEAWGSLEDIVRYRGHLAVLDGTRGLVHVVDADGRFIRNITLRLPYSRVDLVGMAVDSNGFLLLLDRRNARLLVVDDGGNTVAGIGSAGRRPQDWLRAEAVDISTNGLVRILDLGTPPRTLSYRLTTPDVLPRVELLARAGSWRRAWDILKPVLGETGDDARASRAMYLALLINTEAGGSLLSSALLEQAQRVLDRSMDDPTTSLEHRLVLAESYRACGLHERAVAALRSGGAAVDARHAKLLADCSRELAASGQATAVPTIPRCDVPILLAAVHQSYYDTPVVQLVLANRGGKRTLPGRALFLANAVMDNPTETPVPSLEPFSEITLPLRVAFNRTTLTYIEETRLAARVEVRFGEEGANPLVCTKNLTFQMLGRNAIDWSHESMIGSFVTPKDPDIQVFARQALKTVEGHSAVQQAKDPNLFKALTLFDAMQSMGMYYLPDPRQPFSYAALVSGGQIDYVQYPRETLLRLSGDCDDLAVLYASLLEAAGIPAILVTSPGHIFAALKLELGTESIDALGLNRDLLIEREDGFYIPVETTLLGSPFISAWRVAAATIDRHRDAGHIGHIDLKSAWKTYRPVSLPPHGHVVPPLQAEKLSRMLRRELDALNLKQVEKRLAVYKEWLQREPENLSLLMVLTRSYAEVGMFGQARDYGERARRLSPSKPDVYQVLGNLAYMQNDCQRAVALFMKADKLDHSAAIQVNLSLAYLKDGKLASARDAYREAKRLDPAVVSGYPELGQLLE